MQLEWERAELLARCLLASRAGQPPDNDTLSRLESLQHEVQHLRTRADSPWARLPTEGFSPLAMDILVCVLASEARPRVGWLYQDLQPGAAQPFASPALVQALLAIEDEEMRALHVLIGPAGELERRRLLRPEGEGPFTALRPAPGVVARLLDWPEPPAPPPGARLVAQRATWQDLVLAPDRERMLREFLLWTRHRETVIERWGGAALGGPVALFSGPSGTGKTFAAGVIASDLGWPLYRVDLARLVSKYIGETEKNLSRLFDAAHGREMVLQFDEVDALMGRRGEIKDARDRYANVEVSYLLARIEDHRGPIILTTNLRANIDTAFMRRFQLVAEFPRPDQAARKRLWSRMLPPGAPRAPELDLDRLAGAANLTGGNIRNAALHAAYLAAEAEQPIDLGHVATAIWRELAKEHRRLSRADLGALAAYLPPAVDAVEDSP